MGEIKAIKYNWANYSCYLGVILYNDVPKYIKSKSDQSMNRTINDSRVTEIKEYIDRNLSNAFFPPVILNSTSRIDYDNDNCILKANSSSFTIIDGQHRIKAIIDIMRGDNGTKENIRNYTLPFLLVENLEPEAHRSLFNTINENATTVETTVSERFSTENRNLLGLKYISSTPGIKSLIEWENKMSQEKVVYLHLTSCTELLLDCVKEILKEKTEINDSLLYRDDVYFSIYKTFWDVIFDHIKTVSVSDRNFWVKLVTLTALTKQVCSDLRKDSELTQLECTFHEACKKIAIKLKGYLSNLKVDKLIFQYKGSTRRNDSTYKAVIDYIGVNKKLVGNIDEDTIANSQIIDILNGYITLKFMQGGNFVAESHTHLKIIEFMAYIKNNESEYLGKSSNYFRSVARVKNIVETFESQGA